MTKENKLITYCDVDLEALGFTGLPKHVNYFKFEVDALNKELQIAQVTVRYYPEVKDLSVIEEKKYGLVELSNKGSGE